MAELIRTWAPWEKSTGPRTAEGKAKSARNRDRGGLRQKRRQHSAHVAALGRELLRLTRLEAGLPGGGRRWPARRRK